jgi:hypothetical protein
MASRLICEEAHKNDPRSETSSPERGFNYGCAR